MCVLTFRSCTKPFNFADPKVVQEAVHHTVISVSNMTKSLSFYCDGIGLDIIVDTEVKGDWKTLFGSDTTSAHGIYLGDATSVNNGSDGVLELIKFDDVTRGPKASLNSPQTGFFLASFWVGAGLNSTLARLQSLGFASKPRKATFGDPLTTYASIRDPDGTQVLLVSNSYINSVGQRIPSA